MIEFDHVSKTYSGTPHPAVADVSLRVPKWSTTVLVGTSGSGKTTLVRMVNRMVTPTSGRVLVRGENVADADPVKLRRSIGYVLQDGGLFPHRNVIDNIATVPVLEGASRRDAHRRAHELLELVGLEAAMGKRYPAQLSGGQRQRVGVARALANEADILLMDEPFGALDPLVRADLQRELRDLQRRLGTTILFVTHDIDEAFLLGDQVVVLQTGGIVAQAGTPAQILANPADTFVADFVGASQPQRRLAVREEEENRIVVDQDGRPVGVLWESGSDPHSKAHPVPNPNPAATPATTRSQNESPGASS
ncbi:ABC transporter ATP-binding protein [Schaalia vaccimaxillae]|uniref:ABC transporter ATP-binding protein n=1 Tax=Schaalia vaccimaxillae TaxID=183916 RepID=UPI0003B40CDB|nr:ABC transporter ATP-binding protein [Schaalia vaccimaxillae]